MAFNRRRKLSLFAALPLLAATTGGIIAPTLATPPAAQAAPLTSAQTMNVTVTPAAVGKIRLHWTGTSAKGYQVTWTGGALKNGARPSSTLTTAKQDITLSGLASGYTYTVKVKNLSTGVTVNKLAPLGTGGRMILMATPKVPASIATLSAPLDAKPLYQKQTSCDPTPRVGTRALSDLLLTTYKRGYSGMERWCSIGGNSEHHDGRAIDWMVNANNVQDYAAAESFTKWISKDDGANARRLGVSYVIWNGTMWRAYAPERGWTPYTGASPHTDHVHISLTWDGANKATSWWTGKALAKTDLGPCLATTTSKYANLYTTKRTAPCPAPVKGPKVNLPDLTIGASGAQVKKAQAGVGVKADGAFGWGTRNAVIKYQTALKLPVTGVVDAPTWARIAPSSVVR